MKYDFLVETYETERVKALSVWSEFKEKDATPGRKIPGGVPPVRNTTTHAKRTVPQGPYHRFAAGGRSYTPHANSCERIG